MNDTDTTPFEQLLAEFVGAHQDLLDVTREQRDAVSAADAQRLADCTRRQGEIAGRIALLEQRRRELVVELIRRHPALVRPGAQPTLESICPVLPEPSRRRSRELAARLKDLLLTIRREAAGLRTATMTIIAHMDGLMTQIGRRLSHDGTYTRAGGAAPGANVVSGIDLTS